MQKRHDELRGHQLAEMLEEVTGATVSDSLKQKATRGADELDLVRSGLDDTMRDAYQQIRNTLENEERVHDLRTACYFASISKIARSYIDVGVF